MGSGKEEKFSHSIIINRSLDRFRKRKQLRGKQGIKLIKNKEEEE